MLFFVGTNRLIFCGDISRKKDNMDPADLWYLGHVFSATGEAQLSKDWPTLVIQQLPLNALLPIFSLSPHFQPTLSFPLAALWQAPVSKSFNLFNICTRVTLIVGLPPRLTSFWIISFQIFLQIYSNSVSNSPGWNNQCRPDLHFALWKETMSHICG